MRFADITIVPVDGDRKAAYLSFARRMAEVYREHGATRVVDYWQEGESVSPEDFHADGTTYEDGELPELAGVVGAAATESVVVSVTEWPSREARDRGVEAATADPRVTATLGEEPVFDGRRLLASSFSITMDLPDDRPPT